jgi:hypothetical protein
MFGSKDDNVYAVDMDGNSLPEWPITLNGNIEGEIIFSDLDGDGLPEIITVTEAGSTSAFHLDGIPYHHFPISNGLPFTGSPLIVDLDGDSDMEIISGLLNSLSVIDVKDIGNQDNYWNMFRGNEIRTGYYIYSSGSECNVDLGDVNGDTIINILDLVQMANYILEISTPTYECAADFNGDGVVNILDLVQTANYILEN